MFQGAKGDGAHRRIQVAFVVRALGCTVVTVCQIARAVSECPRLTLSSTPCLLHSVAFVAPFCQLSLFENGMLFFIKNVWNKNSLRSVHLFIVKANSTGN